MLQNVPNHFRTLFAQKKTYPVANLTENKHSVLNMGELQILKLRRSMENLPYTARIGLCFYISWIFSKMSTVVLQATTYCLRRRNQTALILQLQFR